MPALSLVKVDNRGQQSDLEINKTQYEQAFPLYT